MTARSVSVDEYLAAQPAQVEAILREIRRTLHEAVPGAQETISYQIPTLALGGVSVVHFAGWRRHVSVYPVPDGDAELARELAPHRSGRGTLMFPLDRPVPYELIGRAAAALVRERHGGAG